MLLVQFFGLKYLCTFTFDLDLWILLIKKSGQIYCRVQPNQVQNTKTKVYYLNKVNFWKCQLHLCCCWNPLKTIIKVLLATFKNRLHSDDKLLFLSFVPDSVGSCNIIFWFSLDFQQFFVPTNPVKSDGKVVEFCCDLKKVSMWWILHLTHLK